MFPQSKSRYRMDQGKYCIDLSMNAPNQLFDERDPAPFRERDLDEDAVDYIVGSLQELPQNIPVKLVLTFPTASENKVQQSVIRDAIRSFFEYQDARARREINFIFQQGQFALFVGVVFLSACLSLSHTISHETVSFPLITAREGLTIIGWVAMWRPLNIFLYEWWPLAAHRRFYKRLTSTEIEFRFASDTHAAA